MIDFAGVPSVTVAMIDNLSDDFNNVLRDTLIMSGSCSSCFAAIGIYSS